MAAPYWDDTTQELIGWPDVWRLFQPLSKPAKRQRLQAGGWFASTQRSAWQELRRNWQALMAADLSWKKQIGDLLRDLPDVEEKIRLIDLQARLLPVDWFELKLFFWKGWQAETMLAKIGQPFAWWRSIPWEMWMRRLQPQGELTHTFSMEDLADAELTRLRGELARLEACVFSGKKEQGDRLRARYKRPPGRDGQYVWDKTDRELLAMARQDEELQLVQENMFEAVFAVVESSELRKARTAADEMRVQVEDREAEVLSALAEQFAPDTEEMFSGASYLTGLDWRLAMARVAEQWGGGGDVVWLEDETAPWEVGGGWHPTVRAAVEQRGSTYTCLDLTLTAGVGLITGPNMGGKTIALKTFGLLQALAQHGLPVPAASFRFHHVERIGMSGGDEQNVASGLSSFGGEMQRLSGLLAGQGRALLLLDEVARTTNPEEGEALAVGLAGYLLTSGDTALFASHFPGVTLVPGIQGFRVAGLRHEVLGELERVQGAADVLELLHSAMDYRLIRCEAGDVPRDAVRLAGCFGLPVAVLERAQQQLDRSGKGGAQTP